MNEAELQILTEQRDNVRAFGEKLASIRDPLQQETASRYLLGVMDGFTLGLTHSQSLTTEEEKSK